MTWKTLQNLPYFIYLKPVAFSVFHFTHFIIRQWNWFLFLHLFSLFWSVSLELFVERKPLIFEEWCMYVIIFQKYCKFWSVSLKHFIKHKPLISEECDQLFWSHYFSTIENTNSVIMVLSQDVGLFPIIHGRKNLGNHSRGIR